MPLLDQQFVSDMGRSSSLVLRYPSVFCAANAQNIFLCEENGSIVSALAAKHFGWTASGKAWRGVMIGAVYTDPHKRGQGFASRLLHWASAELKKQGADFGVLWTLQPEFYARLGWVAADCGLLGKLDDASDVSGSESVATIPIAMADLQQIEHIRRRWLSSMCVRSSGDYQQRPFPVETVDVILWQEGVEATGYALVGGADTQGIIYEMVGPTDCILPLMEQVRSKYRSVLINDSLSSNSHHRLAQYPGLVWADKSLAMWLPLSGAASIAEMSGWYIPYFDRI